jgi:hypothetical protein
MKIIGVQKGVQNRKDTKRGKSDIIVRGGYNYVGKALRNADGYSDKRADEAQFIGNSIDDDMRGSKRV